MRSGDEKEISFFVEEYLKNAGGAENTSLLFRQYVIMDMFFAVKNFLDEFHLSSEEQILEPFQTPSQMQKLISTYSTTVEYISGIFHYAIQTRNRLAKELDFDLVALAKDYMDKNYFDENLNLNEVASQVNVSPNHLSAMFSQKTGQTFVKYLTDVRMTKAKELLRSTNKRSNEISEAIGYKDSHYFSYLFKKNIGCTPLQYREGEAN